jgi:hypothetical protein
MHDGSGPRKRLDAIGGYGSNGVKPVDWYPVTPPNWFLATRSPYVFGQALAALARVAPAGFRVTGNVLEALLDSPDRAGEVIHGLGRSVLEFSRHARRIRRTEKLLQAVRTAHGEWDE